MKPKKAQTDYMRLFVTATRLLISCSSRPRSIRAAALIASLVVFVFAFGAGAGAVLPPKFGGVLHVPVPDRMSRLDPALAAHKHEFMVIGAIYETLIEPGPGGTLRPVLLDGMPLTSDDNLKYYFKLREGIKFHDDSPLDAADVLHSFKQLVNNKHSPYSWIFSDVVGADQYRSGASRTIDGFIIKDPLRFEIELKREQPDLLNFLSFPAAAIIPTTDRMFEPPIGTGPFKYLDKTPHGDIILEAFKDHHRGRPYLDRLEFKLIRGERDRLISFKRGELEVCDVPAGGLTKEEQNMFQPPVISPVKWIYLLDVNPSYSALSTPEYRVSVSNAIDRKGIVKGILNGKAIVTEGLEGEGDDEGLRLEAQKQVYVPVDGKQAAPGEEPEMKEVTISFPLWYIEYMPEYEQIADKIKYDLGELGMQVAPEERTMPGLLQYPADDAPAFIMRSVPLLEDVPASVSELLYNSEYRSRNTAMSLRTAISANGEAAGAPAAAAVMLFAKRPSYVYQPHIYGIQSGIGGVPSFENAFIRKKYTDAEQLDN